MYQALYRKYRPSTFNEVVGQKIIVKTLSNAILNNHINHAYIFCGPRGTGKTSIAKIFAKTINCQNLNELEPCNNCDSCNHIIENKSIDIIEIDAASNNGVDEIRELKNNVNLVPSVVNYKVYIIDEVHMLTTSAFNALLKTLEEPPKHVVFILATTEVHKIPETVLSRCQKFDFQKISITEIKNYLINICGKENIKYEENAILKISEISNGCMRDALSLLDQVSAFTNKNITENDVDEINGNIEHKQMYDIINDISQNKFIKLITTFKQFDNSGKNLSVIIDSIISYLKNILIYINDSEYFKDKKQIDEFEKILENLDENNIYVIIDMLIDTLKNMKYDSNKLLLVELCFIKLNSKLCNQNKKVENNKNENKEKIDSKTYNNIDDVKITNNINTSQIEKVKKIRINNTLSLFNKKDTKLFKQDLNRIKEEINNPKYSSLISLILDGEFKAKGNEYLLFIFKTTSLENVFNSKVNEIETLFNEIYNTKYKVIADNIQSWDKIKQEFNNALRQNKKIYHYIEDNIEYNDIVEKIEQKVETPKTSIDNMFEEIVQYK